MELNREIIACMQIIRRRLRAETGLDIRISSPDAIEQMIKTCARSKSMESRRQGERLMALTHTVKPVEGPVVETDVLPMPSEEELIEKYIKARYTGPLRG